MLSTERFFAAAKRAGMTREVRWTPSGGGAEQVADARFSAPDTEVMGGEAFTTDTSICYPTTQLIGLVRGETITVAGVFYKLREDPHSELDGSRMRAFIQKA